jgi:hypothetical protein
MLLQLLDSTVQATYSLEHLIVLLLIAISLNLRFIHFTYFPVHYILETVDLVLVLIESLLELPSCGDCLHR